MRLLLLFTFASFTLYGQGYESQSWKQTVEKKSGAITISYVQTPGFAYFDNANELTGICIDIMKDFVVWAKESKQIDLKANYVGDGTNFKGMYEKVKGGTGGVFGVGNITITDERKKEVKFSSPFITNFAILVSQNAVQTLNKFEDMPTAFKGLNGYAAKGTTNETRMRELKTKYFPEMKIVATTTSQETLQKVYEDPKGFAYLDLAFYLDAIKQKKNIKRHAVADKAAEQFGIIMPAKSDWSEVFEEFLSADGGYYASKNYNTILVKHLGESGMKFMKAAAK